MSDLVRQGELPPELDTLLAWVACVADARPAEEYVRTLQGPGLTVDHVERHDEALMEMAEAIRARLVGARVLLASGRLEVAGVDLTAAASVARSALDAIRQGTLGYAVFGAVKPPVRGR
jgi:hypothetical protein